MIIFGLKIIFGLFLIGFILVISHILNKLEGIVNMKWKGDNMENKSLVKALYISKNKKSYTKPMILKSGNLLSEDKQKQYSNMY